MAIAVASTASTAFTSGTSVTITKPSGLAEGDLLIAGIFANTGINTASGWTQVAQTSSTFGTKIQYKVATSGDAAASNFTFTSGSSNFIGGALLRVTGYAPTSLFSDSETDELTNPNTNYAFSFTGIAPIRDGELLVAVLGAYDTASQGTSSGYTVNGTNPTWTEVIDDSKSIGALPIHGAVVYATQATKTTITSFSATHTSYDANTDYAITMASLTPQISETGTFTHLSVSPVFSTPTGSSAGVSGSHGHIAVSASTNSQSATATSKVWTTVNKT